MNNNNGICPKCGCDTIIEHEKRGGCVVLIKEMCETCDYNWKRNEVINAINKSDYSKSEAIEIN